MLKKYVFYAKRAFLSIFLIRTDFWHPLCLIIYFTLFNLVSLFFVKSSLLSSILLQTKHVLELIHLFCFYKSSIKFCLKLEIRLILKSLEKCRLFAYFREIVRRKESNFNILNSSNIKIISFSMICVFDIFWYCKIFYNCWGVTELLQIEIFFNNIKNS